MKLEKPQNPNYAAVVVEIKTLLPLTNCDNVVAAPMIGYQAIVGKDTKIGDIGVAFPPECQISAEYAMENNLHRHGDLNKDPDKKGYLEDNRRIKAMKFRGNRSDCLFMPLSSLEFTKIDIDEFVPGDEFDQLNGIEICRKYVVPTRYSARLQKAEPKRFKRVEERFMPEHIDSENYFKNMDLISPETEVIVSQKLHGTSVRIGNTIVLRKLNLVEKLLQKLGVKIQTTEFDYIFGSRHVIKDVNNPDQNHFYDDDIWTREGKKLQGLIPENFLLYGEIVGWTTLGAPIQKGYTYEYELGGCGLYIYRVAFVNDRGLLTDLTWDQMSEFCKERGLKTVPFIWRGKHKNLNPEKYLNTRFFPKHKNCLPLAKGLVDEGICIRADGLRPTVLKAKSPEFLEYESKQLDSGEADIESSEVSNA